MSFLLKWLGLGNTTPRVGLRPHRTVAMTLNYSDAYDRVMDAMATVLGANVYIANRVERRIEAGFGLVKSERIRVTFEPDSETTLVHIEAHFSAGVAVPESSRAVDALAESLAALTTR